MVRAAKHAHVLRIISHYDDYSQLLVMCKVLPCTYTEILKPGRVKYADGTEGRIRGRYRDETAGEFRARWSQLEHTCCEQDTTETPDDVHHQGQDSPRHRPVGHGTPA